MPAGQREISKVLKQSQSVTPICCNFYGQKLPCIGSCKTLLGSEEEAHIHFLLSGRPWSHFWFTVLLPVLIPKRVKRERRMKTVGITISCLWVVAFHLNGCLQRAWRSCKGRGKRKGEQAICQRVRARGQLRRGVKPREKP